MRRMADSTVAASLPAGYDIYAGYVDGHYQSYAPAVAKFWGNARVVPIAVFSSTNAGIVGDVENGDMTPQSCVQWVIMRRAAGVDPTIYCSLALWPTVQQAFNDARVPQPHYWIAAYPGNGANLYPGSVAHQYADQGPNGENIDVSVVADYWPGVDPSPIPPFHEEQDMPLYATNSTGTGFVIATDLSSKRGLPDANDAAALLATGLYKVVQLDDQLLNEIPG